MFICLVLSIFSLENHDSEENAFFLTIKYGKEIFQKFWDNFIWGITFLIIFYYLQQIRGKRKKNLRALRRARGYLIYGEVFNDIISSILERTAPPNCRKAQSLNNSLIIIDDLISLEEKKTSQTILILFILFFVSFENFSSYLNNSFPNLNTYIPILDVLTNLVKLFKPS